MNARRGSNPAALSTGSTELPTSAILFDLHGTLIFQTVPLQGHLERVLSEVNLSRRGLDLAQFLEAWRVVEQSQSERNQRSLLLLQKHRVAAATRLLYDQNPVDFMADVFREAGVAASGTLIRASSQSFQRSWMAGLRVGDGVLPVLRRLKRRYNLGIVSNFRDGRRLRIWLRAKGLTTYFQPCIVISQEARIRKPHPRLFGQALAILRVNDPSHAVYVGDDALEDGVGARLSGMRPAVTKGALHDAGHALRCALDEAGVSL